MMIFVPLPLFASITLALVLVWFVSERDMALRSHQLFAGLVALYGVQSLLLVLRWGYGVEHVAPAIALLAPVLPVLAYLSYSALHARLNGARLWPLGVVALNYLVFWLAPDLVDALILVTYLGFGGLLLGHAWAGPDRLALSPLENGREITVAMALTGACLIASGLTDIYLIVDFIRTGGQQVGLVVSITQTAFVLVIGIAAGFGRVSGGAEEEPEPTPTAQDATAEDSEIMAQLESMFEADALHKDEDLSLRRLARRMGLPDRRVSNAINRIHGTSVSQYVNSHRVRAACDLLRASDDTILAVSLAAGFATKSNFNREFQRVIGMSPSAWRRENKK